MESGRAFSHHHPFQWLPTSTTTTPFLSLRLVHLLHHHHNHHLLHLRSLLHCSFKKLACLGLVPRLEDLWCERTFQYSGINLFQFKNDVFASSCFFDGGDTRKNSASEGTSHIETSRRYPFDGRNWTNMLLAVNVLVYIGQLATQGKLMLWGAKINSLIDKGQIWRLATSSFLHANIAHLLANCYSLNNIGPTMESLCGPRRYLAVYFSSAIASSAMSYCFSKPPAVGASGAIFGLVGSFSVFIMRHRGILGGGRDALEHIAQVIFLNMVIGLLSKGIDNWGHLGGLLGGVAMSWLLGPAWKYESMTKDGSRIYSDKAPISYLIRGKRSPRKLN